MPRPQFTIRTLLVAVRCAAYFFAGMALQRRLDEPVVIDQPAKMTPGYVYTETIRLAERLSSVELLDGMRRCLPD